MQKVASDHRPRKEQSDPGVDVVVAAAVAESAPAATQNENPLRQGRVRTTPTLQKSNLMSASPGCPGLIPTTIRWTTTWTTTATN